MDVAYFLKRRTKFIRFFYDGSGHEFTEIKRRIEAEEPPYENPPYSEDGEPAYLEQWIDADVSLGILGLSCISLLADTLKLYFQTLETRVIGFAFRDGEKKRLFRDGFLDAYKAALGQILGTDWSDCPVDFDIIEQVVLARNRGQHGTSLASLEVTHDRNTLTKHPRPFFASEPQWASWLEHGGNPDSFLEPALEISRNRLFAAIEEVEKLAEWIDDRMDQVWEWRRNS